MPAKARMFMVMQDVNHLKIKSSEIKAILEQLNCEQWCYILHDKDKDDNDRKIRPHYHILIKFINPRSLNSIAKSFKVKPQYVQIWSGKNAFNNGLSYLVHETNEAIGKYHYSDEEVFASFDFHKKMESIRQQVRNNSTDNNIQKNIHDYSAGLITKNQLEDVIGVYGMAKNKRLIDNITDLLNKQKYDEWAKNYKGVCKTYYIFGKTGVGKTELSLWALKKLEAMTGEASKVLGSTRDPFEFYESEKFILLDDLRPNILDYSTMLKLFDPRPFGKVLPARYHDHANVRAEVILITGPYSLKRFYELTGIQDRNIDNFDQLARRITEIQFTEESAKKFHSSRPKINSKEDLFNYLKGLNEKE